jgi:hypothetical protein
LVPDPSQSCLSSFSAGGFVQLHPFYFVARLCVGSLFVFSSVSLVHAAESPVPALG